MITQLITVVDAAASLPVHTRHGLATLIGGQPTVHVGSGEFRPTTNDNDGTWSYWRVLGQPVATRADIGEPCAGVDLSIPLRFVAWVDREECSDAMMGAVNSIRLSASDITTALGAVTAEVTRSTWGIDAVWSQEYSPAQQPTAARMLVNIDITIRVLASEDCLVGCGDGISVLCRLISAASNAAIADCIGADRLSELCGGGVGCPYDGVITIDGVPSGTFGPFDPCEDNTLNINITYS